MPQFTPSRGDVHVNRPLTQISLAYIQGEGGFVADRVFPNIPVPNKSDRYFTYDRGEWNRDEMQLRAPGTESAGGSYTIDSTPTYNCEVYAYHRDVDDQIRGNQDSPIQLDREASEFVSMKAMLKREKTWRSKYFQTGVWAKDITGVASGEVDGTSARFWNDNASDPIEQIRLGRRTTLESTGFQPNVAVMGKHVYDRLLDHPDIVGRIDRGQTTGPAIVTRQNLAALFELDEILVMEAIENTAKKGATPAHSFIGGKHCLLVYRAPRPGLMTPSGGYTFSWTGYFGMTRSGTRVKRFRVERLNSDRVEIEMAYDQKLVAADVGYFFAGIVQ